LRHLLLDQPDSAAAGPGAHAQTRGSPVEGKLGASPFRLRPRFGSRVRDFGPGVTGTETMTIRIEFTVQLQRAAQCMEAAIAVIADVHHATAGWTGPVNDVESPKSKFSICGPIIRHRADLHVMVRSIDSQSAAREYAKNPSVASSMSGPCKFSIQRLELAMKDATRRCPQGRNLPHATMIVSQKESYRYWPSGMNAGLEPFVRAKFGSARGRASPQVLACGSTACWVLAR
jgi:hypothetical protein